MSGDGSTAIKLRSFVKTAGIAGGVVAAGAVSSTAFADEKPAEGFASQVTETKERDICVVGAGITGLAASVQAGCAGFAEAQPLLTTTSYHMIQLLPQASRFLFLRG